MLVSVLAHVLVMSGGWRPLPAPPATTLPLQAQLLERAAPDAQRHSVPESPRPAEARARVPTHPVLAAPLPMDTALPAPPMDGDSPDVAASPGDGTAPAPERGAFVADAPPAAAAVEPARLPRKAYLTYALYLGTDGFSVGRSVFSWEVDRNAYRLVSASETTGIADLLRPQRLTYTSEGALTDRGLRPRHFAMSRTRRGVSDAAQAILDWEAGRLTYGRPAQQLTVDLPVASQDIVSFVFQLALNPPAPGRIRLPITNGLRIETYELEVLAEERIETPLGALATLPLRQLRKDGAEGIEVWLALDYRYLPVKVRFLDRDGNPAGEQVILEIRTSQE